MMKKVESIRMSLNLYRTMNFNARVVMKDNKIEPFIALVLDFNYKEPDDRVTFQRSELTESLPNDEENNPAQTYTTYIKNIKEVDWVREKKKINRKAYLEELVAKMNGEMDSEKVTRGSEKVSWKANREAEKVKDEAFFPYLKELLENEKNIGKRQAIYTLLGHLGSNLRSSDIIETMLESLAKEKEESMLHHILLGVFWAGIPISNFTKEIINLVDDERELVRNAAIRCLSLDANKSKESELALIEVLENAYDEYGVRYSANSLSKIGTAQSLPTLKKALKEFYDEETITALKDTIEVIENQDAQ